MKREFTLKLDETSYKIAVNGNSILVNGQPFVIGFEEGRVLVDGTPFDVKLDGDRAIVGGIAYKVTLEGLVEDSATSKGKPVAGANEGAVTAIMPGKIIRIVARVGDKVAEGDVVCILEAMKMENELKAARAGRVRAIHVTPGKDVERGSVLIDIE